MAGGSSGSVAGGGSWRVWLEGLVGVGGEWGCGWRR